LTLEIFRSFSWYRNILHVVHTALIQKHQEVFKWVILNLACTWLYLSKTLCCMYRGNWKCCYAHSTTVARRDEWLVLLRLALCDINKGCNVLHSVACPCMQILLTTRHYCCRMVHKCTRKSNTSFSILHEHTLQVLDINKICFPMLFLGHYLKQQPLSPWPDPQCLLTIHINLQSNLC